ncbi:MAG: monomeric [FeFe] hydrogenase, partial [Oscillospiraceae bacterium]
YKERAIVNERVKLAMGGDESNPNVVEVLKIACDECPVDGIHVSEACRGCIAHRCINACPKDAIQIKNHHAVIDKDKCIECGRCVNACPYSAIVKNTRPCEKACKPGAISMGENKKATIDNSKCISCGACVYQCPFGAISDKSYILQAIKMIKESENNTKYKVYAVTAPSMASQYENITIEQVVDGIKHLGFFSVVEAALGADMTAFLEAQELAEKGFLTSSCCPAFVSYVKKNFPDMVQHISHNLSPMAQISKYIKRKEPSCKIVFIGPCIAKKDEIRLNTVKDYVDCVITFEEMQALFDARDIDLSALDGVSLDNASYYGRVFARSGGLAVAVEQALLESSIPSEMFEYKPISCNGILECKTALLKATKKVLTENFIEGMACENGCIGGAACLSHGPKDKTQVDNYGRQSKEKTIRDAIEILNFD